MRLRPGAADVPSR